MKSMLDEMKESSILLPEASREDARARGAGKGEVPLAKREALRRVLVVDDEETVGLGMSEILKDAGFDASYVTSGGEAVEAVKRRPYSLVFMDMMMPGLNGLETYRRMREFSRDIRVVIFTGYFKEVDKAIYQGIKEGMIDVYIRKPFFAEEIVNTARKYA